MTWLQTDHMQFRFWQHFIREIINPCTRYVGRFGLRLIPALLTAAASSEESNSVIMCEGAEDITNDSNRYSRWGAGRQCLTLAILYACVHHVLGKSSKTIANSSQRFLLIIHVAFLMGGFTLVSAHIRFSLETKPSYFVTPFYLQSVPVHAANCA
jgi:hypothetical protein